MKDYPMSNSFFTVVLLATLIAASVAAADESYRHMMDYQGILNNSLGEPVADGSYSMTNDTTVTLEGSSAGAHLSLKIPPGGGSLGSEVKIADLDMDGSLDLRVGGNVGIGVTNPSTILEVVQGSSTDPVADAWGIHSSRRWKKNIKTLDDALQEVGSLRGVEYDWKADCKHDIGLIAEEVGEVFPEIVAYEKNGIDARSVDYARLVAVLIEAVKDLKVENDQLKSDQARFETTSNDRLNKLENQVTQLSTILEQLMTSQTNSTSSGGESVASAQQGSIPKEKP